MNSPRNALALPIAFSIAVALVVVGHDAFGTRPASAPPTHVATVDIAKVFERIEANAPWEIELNALAERLNEEATRRQEAIQRQLEQSEATEDAVEKQRIRDQAALMKLELAAGVDVEIKL